MAQVNKELLLRDLCSRLPYGIKASYYGTEEECETWDEIEGITFDGYVGIGQYSLPIESVKPYLFPISSMTKEDIYQIKDMLGEDFEIDETGITDLIRNRCTSLTYLELDMLFNYLNKNHFDYRGLIDKSLAIDATGLNIY